MQKHGGAKGSGWAVPLPGRDEHSSQPAQDMPTGQERMDDHPARRSFTTENIADLATSAVRRLLVLLLAVLACVPSALRAQAPQPEYVLDSTLRVLKVLRDEENAPPSLRPLLTLDKVGVSIRFRRSWLQSTPNLARLERELDIEFARVNGKLAEIGGVYGARVPWEAFDQLAQWPGVLRVDSTWKPAMATSLDVSVREIHAEDVWDLLDGGGWPVTGRGIVIANFDTGIDVFHPDFWRADGGTYPWLDVNSNETFDPGTDAVDLNRDGTAQTSERLDTLDSTSLDADHVPGTEKGVFQARTDWLYNDANLNRERDYGPLRGFTEQDPTYGERLFLLDDQNGNGSVDRDEVLLALSSNKVQRTRHSDGVERTRGVDLIANSPDVDGHGTRVSSILCGGQAGSRRYTGVAPGSKLLLHQLYDAAGNNAYPSYIPWAESNGAQIMLYPFGSWIQEFLDGSSNLEQMLDAEAAKGIVQVAAAGNLADTHKHAHLILSTFRDEELRFLVPYSEGLTDAWISILWPAPLDAVSLRLVTPLGTAVLLPGNDTTITVDGHSIWSYRERSTAGTSKFDLLIYRGGSALTEGDWGLQLDSQLPYGLNVNAYIADLAHAWSSGAIFLDHIDDMYTVTSPGTANSAITAASYSTRGREGGELGSLSPFSSQGPRIDGERVLDVAAPGHYADIACASSKDVSGGSFGQYGWFGGTSAAAPHVAGAVALMLQKMPGVSPQQVQQALRDSARQDSHTGLVPNFRWGWGKLDIGTALSAPRKPTPTPRARILLPILLKRTQR
jgi:subtilisin family serine protease